MPHIHIIGRAIILIHHNVLLARDRIEGHVYPPGGHVEYGESAHDAIIREASEEFGGEITVGPFLGAIEHAFDYQSEKIHEVSFVFAATPLNFAYPKPPISRESRLDIFWYPVGALKAIGLLPPPMAELIDRHVNGSETGMWFSTLR